MRQGLIIGGIVLLLAGLAWPWLGRLPFGDLPGDVSLERPGFRFYAPLGTSLLLSVGLSLLLAVVSWFWRR